jgi:hypothetical protein
MVKRGDMPRHALSSDDNVSATNRSRALPEGFAATDAIRSRQTHMLNAV